jgi:hypothetical protein
MGALEGSTQPGSGVGGHRWKDHLRPMTGVPETIARGMAAFRDLFGRAEGFEHVSRDVTGLILRPKKTVPGISDLHVWGHDPPRRGARHDAVVEAAWDSQALIQRHRATVARDQRGRGRAVISLDWTRAPHERGPHLCGVALASDEVQKRTRRFQTVVTAVISNGHGIDGVEAVGQAPQALKEEVA